MKFLCVLLLGALTSHLQSAAANSNGNEPHMNTDGPTEDHGKEPEKPDDAEIICRCYYGCGDSKEANVKTEVISEEIYPRCLCFQRKGHEEEPVKTDFVDCAPKPCWRCGKEESKVDCCVEERVPRVCGCSSNRIVRAPYPIEKSIVTRPRCRQCGCSRNDAFDCSCDRHSPEEKYIYCRPSPHFQH